LSYFTGKPIIAIGGGGDKTYIVEERDQIYNEVRSIQTREHFNSKLPHKDKNHKTVNQDNEPNNGSNNFNNMQNTGGNAKDDNPPLNDNLDKLSRKFSTYSKGNLHNMKNDEQIDYNNNLDNVSNNNPMTNNLNSNTIENNNNINEMDKIDEEESSHHPDITNLRESNEIMNNIRHGMEVTEKLLSNRTSLNNFKIEREAIGDNHEENEEAKNDEIESKSKTKKYIIFNTFFRIPKL